jgi:transcriptional regulator GlxA family with amidase domain
VQLLQEPGTSPEAHAQDLQSRIKAVLESGRMEARRLQPHRSFLLALSAERLMWERVDEPLRLNDLCRQLHCGSRRLIYAFKSAFGVAPMTYLKVSRLGAVQRRLLSAPARTRILDVAGEYGFWHMGHFGADFRRMFGTTASKTLARSGVAPKPSLTLLRR